MNETDLLQLIEQNQGVIHKICKLYRNSKEDREDLFQEIVFQLWKSAPKFEGRAKFSSWMYRIAFSTAVAGFRKKRLDIVYSEILPDKEDRHHQPTEKHDQLFDALKQLDDADKALITLYLEDMSYQEIAGVTGISESNVGVRLNRIKIKIKKILTIR